MKKILVLCSALALFFSGCSNDDGPGYGSFAEVSTPAQMQDAINSGSTEVVLKQALTEDLNLVVSSFYPSISELTLRIPQANGKNVKVSQNSFLGLPFPDLTLEADGANNVEIDMPDMEVDFDGSASGALTASTSLLSILPGAQVGTLNVSRGNIRLFGTVGTFGSIPVSSKVLRAVSTETGLRDQLALPYDHITNGGVVLTANVAGTYPSISGAVATQNVFNIGDSETYENSDYDGYVFDGNGFTLSGAAWNNVLSIFADNVIVNDLKITQTDAQKATLKEGGAPAINNGITIYRVQGVVLNNVTVTNCGKAGIIVSSSEVTANNLTLNGNSWGGVNLSKGVNPPGGGTAVFVLTSGSVSGQVNPVYVSLNTADDYSVTTPSGWTHATAESGDIVYQP